MVGLVEAKDYLAEAAVLENKLKVFLRSNGGAGWGQGLPGRGCCSWRNLDTGRAWSSDSGMCKWLIYNENLQYDFQKALHPNVFATSFAQRGGKGSGDWILYQKT